MKYNCYCEIPDKTYQRSRRILLLLDSEETLKKSSGSKNDSSS